MPDLSLSEDERLVQETMARFAKDELRAVHLQADHAEQAPEDLLAKGQTDLAIAVMTIPEKFGGAWEGTPQDVQAAIRGIELGYGCPALTLALPGPGLGAHALVGGLATDEQATRILEPFVGEEPAWAALALTEPISGARFGDLEARAKKSGDGWKISGVKGPVVNASRALGFVVIARAVDGEKDLGVRVFWVKADAEGVKVADQKWLGLRAAGLGKVTFENAPAELLGEDDPEKQLAAAQGILDRARLEVAALMAGMSRAALDTSIEFSKTRVQFGEPIGQKQGIAFLQADMGMESEGARMLVLKAASKAEMGKAITCEAAEAYGFAARAAMFVTVNAVQIHGGYGFIREYPVEKWMRDAKTLGLLLGDQGVAFEEVGSTL